MIAMVSSPDYAALTYSSQSVTTANQLDVYVCTVIDHCCHLLRPGWLGSIGCPPPETLSTLWQYLKTELPVRVQYCVGKIALHCAFKKRSWRSIPIKKHSNFERKGCVLHFSYYGVCVNWKHWRWDDTKLCKMSGPYLWLQCLQHTILYHCVNVLYVSRIFR